MDRTLEFVAKFACSFLEKDENSNDDIEVLSEFTAPKQLNISNVLWDVINTISKEVVENSAIDIVNNSHEKPDLRLRIENPNLNKQTNECVLGKDAQTCNDSLKKNVLQMEEENVDHKAEETPIEKRDAEDIRQVASSFQRK